MEKQLLGTQQPLQKGPADMTQNRPSSGTAEILGDQAPISRTPVSMANFWTGGSSDRQILGSEAPLNKTPHKGWESHPTPMSKRAVDQSKT